MTDHAASVRAAITKGEDRPCRICGRTARAVGWEAGKGYRCEACQIQAKIDYIERLMLRLPELRARAAALAPAERFPDGATLADWGAWRPVAAAPTKEGT